MNEFGKYDTTIDPCPTCHTPVEGIDSRTETVRSNPQAVLSDPDPNCPRFTDPDADCTCTAVINPAPPPYLDRYVPVADWITFKPCGHVFEAHQLEALGWEMTRTVKRGWHQEQIDRLRADAAEHGVEVR